MVNDISLMHLHINRGKQSLGLDLKVPEAVQVFEDLVRVSHVVIEAMRPGFLDKRGLGYARLRELNPAIVMCTISGYGATGPYRDLPSHGIAYDAWAGTLQPVIDDEGFARIPDQANIGITAGPAFGAIGILAALIRAHGTGEGANMEIAQSDSSAYFDWYRIETWKGYDERPDTEVTGNPSDDYERRAPGLAGMWEGVRYQYYEAADGYILFMASEQAFWKNFCEGVGRMDLFEKWPGKRIADHARGNKDLQAELRDIFKTRTITEWIAFADEHNTTIAPANTPRSVRDDPQFEDRFEWTTREQTGIAEMLFPLKVEGEQLPVPGIAPTVGEHTDDVLTRVLGYDVDRLAKLRATGALG
jgi:crotonobetainyl-CoA:carnitine CoA-transferase CaiB-like acyl-CoA transferase